LPCGLEARTRNFGQEEKEIILIFPHLYSLMEFWEELRARRFYVEFDFHTGLYTPCPNAEERINEAALESMSRPHLLVEWERQVGEREHKFVRLRHTGERPQYPRKDSWYEPRIASLEKIIKQGIDRRWLRERGVKCMHATQVQRLMPAIPGPLESGELLLFYKPEMQLLEFLRQLIERYGAVEEGKPAPFYERKEYFAYQRVQEAREHRWYKEPSQPPNAPTRN
jgi:hypothetical protein